MSEDIAGKKHAIFESTLEIIRDHGFHGAPMSLIAKNAGVAAGTIYHYFPSKDQLILELYDYNRDRLTAVIESSLRPDLSYKENFFLIWANLYQFYVREPNVLIFFEQFINSPFNVTKYQNFSKGRLFDFFSTGIRKKILKAIKPEFLLLLVLGSISSTAKVHVFGKVPISNSDMQRIAEVLWDGIATPEQKAVKKTHNQTSTHK